MTIGDKQLAQIWAVARYLGFVLCCAALIYQQGQLTPESVAIISMMAGIIFPTAHAMSGGKVN